MVWPLAAARRCSESIGVLARERRSSQVVEGVSSRVEQGGGGGSGLDLSALGLNGGGSGDGGSGEVEGSRGVGEGSGVGDGGRVGQRSVDILLPLGQLDLAGGGGHGGIDGLVGAVLEGGLGDGGGGQDGGGGVHQGATSTGDLGHLVGGIGGLLVQTGELGTGSNNLMQNNVFLLARCSKLWRIKLNYIHIPAQVYK